MKIRLTLQYDGNGYAGYQKQDNILTIQEKLERTLSQVYGYPLETIGSGRTDVGVHADGQVIHFNVEENKIPLSRLASIMNRLLPDNIRVVEAFEVSRNFHARYSARVRMYRYTLEQVSGGRLFPQGRHAYQPGFFLDISQLEEYLRPLIGRHDFSSFCHLHDGSRTKEREIFHITVHEKENYIYIDFYGNGFLRNMIRSIVGTLLFAYRKKKKNDYLANILVRRSPLKSKARAPGKALTLHRVYYTKIFGDRPYYKDWSEEPPSVSTRKATASIGKKDQ